jgi:hypothetical protein
MMSEPLDIGPMREWIADLPAVVEDLKSDLAPYGAGDLRVRGQAELDAIATLTGLTEDDLVSLCIVLTKRLLKAEGRGEAGEWTKGQSGS